ncbi:MAG TPA: FAD-binding oxidoreductase [Candidatus Acidoferrales bacterium]|nr:FAD-binding oxidoreductase [Candidatus Acidoferrales bacterium]
MRRRHFIELSAGLSAAALLPGTAWGLPTFARAHIVVVGGGIVGASIAYHLIRRGVSVTVCEKTRPAAGATANSFAWINSTYSKEPRSYYDLNVMGMAGWRRLDLEFSGELKVQWGGCVEWYPAGAEADTLRKEVIRAQQWGYAAHLVQATEFGRLLPSVRPGSMAAASFCEREGTVDPVYVTQTILAKAKQLGARTLYPCEVTGLVRSGNRVSAVETSEGRFELHALVLASGVDTPRLAAMADVRVPLKDSPGVLAHAAPTARLLDRVALGPQAHMKQNPDGRVVTGSDFGGTPTTDASRETGEKLLAHAAAYLPGLAHAKLERVTLGWRVMPQDEYPILGFAEPRCPNLYVAATHSGVTLAPLIGQFAAAEILDGARVGMLEPYRLSRFG